MLGTDGWIDVLVHLCLQAFPKSCLRLVSVTDTHTTIHNRKKKKKSEEAREKINLAKSKVSVTAMEAAE